MAFISQISGMWLRFKECLHFFTLFIPLPIMSLFLTFFRLIERKIAHCLRSAQSSVRPLWYLNTDFFLSFGEWACRLGAFLTISLLWRYSQTWRKCVLSSHVDLSILKWLRRSFRRRFLTLCHHVGSRKRNHILSSLTLFRFLTLYSISSLTSLE